MQTLRDAFYVLRNWWDAWPGIVLLEILCAALALLVVVVLVKWLVEDLIRSRRARKRRGFEVVAAPPRA